MSDSPNLPKRETDALLMYMGIYLFVYAFMCVCILVFMCVCVYMRIVMGVMKMVNTVPRRGLEPTSLTFRASVLPLPQVGFPDVITITTPTCLYSSLPERSVQTTTLVPLEL